MTDPAGQIDVYHALLEFFSIAQVVFDDPVFGSRARERAVIGRLLTAYKECRQVLEKAAETRY